MGSVMFGSAAVYESRSENEGVISRLRSALDRRRLGELLVANHLITPSQLQHVLNEQKESKEALGQILLKKRLITRRQLGTTLAKQYALRCTAATVFFCASMLSSSQKEVSAEMLQNVPAQVTLLKTAAASGAAFSSPRYYPALLGSMEKESSNIKPFTKWTGMFQKFDADMRSGSGVREMQAFNARLEEFRNLPLRSMADKVNTLVNQTRYITDSKNWGTSDYWATPVEFLKRGGDCEDFAIAKYTALRELGVPESRLRIAIVHDNLKNIPHAVLVVYTDQGSYILDNQNKNMLNAQDYSRYRPIFSINRTAWWLHTAPDEGVTRVASAR